MKNYFTVTGMNYRLGTDFMKEGMTVKLVKEPDNKHDKEAIKVEMKALGTIGYVANSVHTVIGESMSAGRLYDRIGDTAVGKVLYIFDGSVVCEVIEED